MKRYDNDEQMAAALEVFLFDTLTDPTLEYTDAPQEPAYTMPEPTFVYPMQDASGKTFHWSLTNLPNRVSHCHALALSLLQPVSGMSLEESRDRLDLAQAAIARMAELVHG